MPAEDTVLELREAGFNWAEATLLAVCREVGIDSSAMPRIATPFGGGFGSCGLVCGALTGAVMAVGLAVGRETADGSRQAANEATRELVDGFQAEMGSTLCSELTGADLRTEEGHRHMIESDARHRVCDPAVLLATRRAVEVLRK